MRIVENRHVPNYIIQIKALEKELAVKGTANVFRAALKRAKETVAEFKDK